MPANGKIPISKNLEIFMSKALYPIPQMKVISMQILCVFVSVCMRQVSDSTGEQGRTSKLKSLWMLTLLVIPGSLSCSQSLHNASHFLTMGKSNFNFPFLKKQYDYKYLATSRLVLFRRGPSTITIEHFDTLWYLLIRLDHSVSLKSFQTIFPFSHTINKYNEYIVAGSRV